ncbi:MAG TPA: beta-ketoacyl-ACP synthase 3 [Kineosporiaceae bacterium]
MYAALTHITTHLPSRVETNADLCTRMDTTDEWIVTRTGIAQRHLAAPGESTADLAVAAMTAFAAERPGTRVDTLVLATTSPDRTCPATAPEVAARVGLGGIAGYDITSACSGDLYGLATAVGLVDAGIARRVALVTSETFSYFVDPADRTTAPLFGDAATVSLVERVRDPDDANLGPFDLGSDGAGLGLLEVPAGGARARALAGRGRPVAWESGSYLQMAGRPLFLEAVARMSASCRKLLADSGSSIDDIDGFVVHQANARIARALCEELDIPDGKALSNIRTVGNTLSSSIPLLLADSAAAGTTTPGDTLLLTAFGAGLSWGSCLLTWNPR